MVFSYSNLILEYMENRCCCSFCAEIDRRIEDNLFRQLFGPEIGFSYILKETANFVVMPTIGALVPGYLLLLPRSHVLSFGHVPPSHFKELRQLMEFVLHLLSTEYGLPVIIFEHGPTSKKSCSGSCADHAHWHLVPVPRHIDLLSSMHRRFDVRKIHNIEELCNQIKRNISYLLLKHNDGKYYLCDAMGVESQFFRRELARQLGLGEVWNWVISPFKDQIAATIKHLGKQLKPENNKSFDI